MKEARMTRPIHPQHALAARFVPRRQGPNKSIQRMGASRSDHHISCVSGGCLPPLMLIVRQNYPCAPVALDHAHPARGRRVTRQIQLV